MEHRRPDPDHLLRQVQAAERLQGRARLKVFLGAAPGVGKTFAMLQEARARQAGGGEVVAGVVETHGRSETAALLEGMEFLPRKQVPYRGVSLEEFDLDGALARKPALLLVDELAHTNAPGGRHDKRWQDVMELLDAGIEVFTTVNIQHIETHRDAVAKITGVLVRETVPDTVLERADEIELVDLPVEVLQQRLRDGKVYLPEQAKQAADRFFRKGNLLALREMALRKTAERVDAEMRRYMEAEGIHQTWPAAERILVAVGASPEGTRLVRYTARMAAALGAPWMAVHVERFRGLLHSAEAEARVQEALRLAERLGAEVVDAPPEGLHAVEDLLAFARARRATKIVVGKPSRAPWVERFSSSLVMDLVHRSGDIDIHVVAGEGTSRKDRLTLLPALGLPSWAGLGMAAAAVALCSALNHLLRGHLDLADMTMLYLLCIAVMAARFGRWTALGTSVMAVAALDFLFVPPYYTFAVEDMKHVGTFAIMLGVGLAIGDMAERIRAQARMARDREQHAQELYHFSADLAREGEAGKVRDAARERISQRFGCPVALLLPEASGQLAPDSSGSLKGEEELAVAQWAFDHQAPAGRGTDTLPGARGSYLPLLGTEGPVGVLGLLLPKERPDLDQGQRHLLEALASQAALTLERARLAEERAQARREVDREQMRNVLLSSISHDLRTPLGAITGAASTLLDPPEALTPEGRRDLLSTIQEESQRLHRLVINLLDLTRLESGTLKVQKEWVPLEEVIGSALARMEASLGDRPVRLDLTDTLVAVDPILIEQVLVNLLENALKYSSPGSPLGLASRLEGDFLLLSLTDSGPGIQPGEEEKIFEKLVRGSAPTARPGAGLGLAICRGLVKAHGGWISASNRPEGGAHFLIGLPHPSPPEGPPSEDVDHG
ncbi:MAG: sensor histidine kinase KdpD [Acidobacteria bacterium]|nr:sensor histidine kinase KdpD [Acidobacteriota bacterium]